MQYLLVQNQLLFGRVRGSFLVSNFAGNRSVVLMGLIIAYMEVVSITSQIQLVGVIILTARQKHSQTCRRNELWFNRMSIELHFALYTSTSPCISLDRRKSEMIEKLCAVTATQKWLDSSPQNIFVWEHEEDGRCFGRQRSIGPALPMLYPIDYVHPAVHYSHTRVHLRAW